jgi:signal transduction protein with GAF and PtsI domain
MREIGRGTRVFEAEPVHGSLKLLEGPEDVLDLLDNGADGVIAVVRDAGATFLAPLYHDLAGVICTAGTLRSHIGIVTRDFRLPCIMGAAFDEELVDGQVVELDCSTDPGVLRV